MVVIVKKGTDKKKINEALRKIKPLKKVDAKRHLGLVKWGEDALEFQKRIRNEGFQKITDLKLILLEF